MPNIMLSVDVLPAGVAAVSLLRFTACLLGDVHKRDKYGV